MWNTLPKYCYLDIFYCNYLCFVLLFGVVIENYVSTAEGNVKDIYFSVQQLIKLRTMYTVCVCVCMYIYLYYIRDVTL